MVRGTPSGGGLWASQQLGHQCRQSPVTLKFANREGSRAKLLLSAQCILPTTGTAGSAVLAISILALGERGAGTIQLTTRLRPATLGGVHSTREETRAIISVSLASRIRGMRTADKQMLLPCHRQAGWLPRTGAIPMPDNTIQGKTVRNHAKWPWTASMLRIAGGVALFAAVSACTNTDRYDLPRPASSAPTVAPSTAPATTGSQGVGPGSQTTPYYQGADPNFPRGTGGRRGP